MDYFLLLISILTYVGLNLLSFGTFALDKHRAKIRSWRIPEISLLIFAVFGPFGALAAMKLYLHKTRHAKFLLVPALAMIHILFGIYLFAPLLW
jgi:uncharacterized membrane protein YsdA (DUF1294 family)